LKQGSRARIEEKVKKIIQKLDVTPRNKNKKEKKCIAKRERSEGRGRGVPRRIEGGRRRRKGEEG
jgi:hypothetical protein